MPKRHLFVRGFWGPRKEAADECAARWLAFFERLSRVAPPAFAGWRSAEDNEPPVDLDHESLTALAMRLTDDERLDMGIGFRLSAWCERPGWPRVDFSATAGSESDNPRVRNSVVLTLFARSDADIGQWSPLLGEALLALAEEWEPDWGDVGTHSLWDAQEQAAAISVIAPRSGLVTYL